VKTTLGQVIRRVLGPAVDPIIRRYRRFFVDLEAWGRSLAGPGPVGRILEIGCGDGHMCEVLAATFPHATVLGIDIAETPGGLYAGRRQGVEFRQATVEELAGSGVEFDLVVFCDVLHHVPVSEQSGLVASAWGLVAPGGSLAVKDWVAGRDPFTLAAYLSDRFVTGDQPVFFDSARSLTDLLTENCQGATVVVEGTVPPRDNNRFLVLLRSEA
jgi:2-polyprenyl-3-methyl-5-hydroxy-6-metoxy-1,4-benzoquinol methylase